MSATVTYKGATLTTATNQTRVLETEGTYLEDDITITDVTTIPTGTKNISITANGTTTEDVTSYASASITANVPNSYTASDEGKVVSNGSLVSQSSATYTANGTYDTTLVDDVTVDVQGGGGASGFDLLEDITISQAVRSYQIDFQNTWYSYDRIFLYINGQFVGGNDYIYWNVNATTLDSGKYSNNISSFDFMYEVISVPLSGNAIKVDVLAVYSNGHYTLMANNSSLTSMDVVSYFWFSGYSKNLAIGTKIKVYGVKYADL